MVYRAISSFIAFPTTVIPKGFNKVFHPYLMPHKMNGNKGWDSVHLNPEKLRSDRAMFALVYLL